MPEVYGPWLFDGEGFVEGGVVVSKGRVIELLGSPPEDASVEGAILPPLANPHTHIGDAFIKRVPKGTVEEVVAPPVGFKFRMLAKAPAGKVVEGMRGAITEMRRTGTGTFADFREGGLEGVRAIRRVLKGQRIEALVLGRPETLRYVEEEVASLLREADGLGLSSVSEWSRRDLLAMAEQAREAGKPLAIHASERVREPFERVAELGPAHVVHMTRAGAGDLRMCEELDIPVVVCPRSNAFFGVKPPVRRMLDAGLTVALGTDNAMLARPDLLGEARFLRRTQRDLAPEEVARMAVANGRKVLNQGPGLGLRSGGPARFAVVHRGRGSPHDWLLDPRCAVENVG